MPQGTAVPNFNMTKNQQFENFSGRTAKTGTPSAVILASGQSNSPAGKRYRGGQNGLAAPKAVKAQGFSPWPTRAFLHR